MNWKVAVTAEVKARIAAQHFTPATTQQIYRRLLDDLSGGPDAINGNVVVPFAHTKAHYFDFGAPPCRTFFMFAVRRLPESDELQMIGCRILQEIACPN